ncbi:MAG: ATP-binding cassette domain-containing protein, partial [Paramuribaculum sp.]|nr:ATP-binding cassette domain-containing protein [Paramuribaculum sp.]
GTDITDPDRKRRLILQTAEAVGMESRLDSSIGQLSGGQLQRTLLGRAIIASPRVLVLDEPLSYVDKPFESRIYDIMQQLSATTTIILVSHEISRIASMANRHIIVNRRLHFCHSANHFVHYDCCDE